MAGNPSVEAYKAKLKRIPPAVRGQAWSALLKFSVKIHTAMILAAPRDDGNLQRSIVRVLDPTRLRVTLKAGGALTTRQVRAGASVSYDYAMAQEFGTVDMAAQPFFWPTWRAHRDQMRRGVKKAIKDAIAKEFPPPGSGLLEL